MRSSRRAVCGSSSDRAQGAAVIALAPGRRRRCPVAGAEATVRVRERSEQHQELGQEGHHARNGGEPSFGQDARSVAEERRTVDRRVQREARVAAQPGKVRPELRHEGGLLAAAGEVRLGVELGQRGRVGRGECGLRSRRHLQAARAELGTHVVDGDGAAVQRRHQVGQRLLLGREREGGPTAVRGHGGAGSPAGPDRPRGGRRTRFATLEHDALELPSHPRFESRRHGTFDEAPELEAGRHVVQRRLELGQEQRTMMAEGVRATRAELDPGRVRGRATRPAHGVVEAPPLDGVDETPPRLHGPRRGRGVESLLA